MPWSPLPPCRYPGCPNLQTRERNGFCQQHQAEADRRQKRGRFRDRTNSRAYGRPYQRARAWVLQRQPLCVRCLEEGKVVEAEQTHHIQPVAEGGRSTPDNLLPLCRRHHLEEHAPGFSGGERWRPAGGASRETAHLSQTGFRLQEGT